MSNRSSNNIVAAGSMVTQPLAIKAGAAAAAAVGGVGGGPRNNKLPHDLVGITHITLF
jgi:hypothetical protein